MAISRQHNRIARKGFSLIELLIVVVISGILLALSGGAISRQIQRDRALRSATVVQGLLTQASALATRRNMPVRVVLVNGTTIQIQDRTTNEVLKERSFGSQFDLRATVTFSPTAGIEIFPNGRANSALRVSVSGGDYTQVVSRTATGIVRRQ